MALEPRFITAPDLASELGHSDGGKKLRSYLRRRYPDHFHGQRWLISETQADAARRHFGAGRIVSEGTEPVTSELHPTPETVRTGVGESDESGGTEGIVAAAVHALSGARWAIADAPAHVPGAPGLYAIYGDEQAWSDLRLDPVPEQPLYVGKAEDSLVSRDLNGHFALNPRAKARTGSSTVRRSFAALLRESLALHAVPRNLAKPERFSNYGLAEGGDARLNEWMHARLTLAVWPSPAGMPVPLRTVETAVIVHFTPPINIDKNPRKLARLSAARSAMAAEASQWTSQQTAAVERIVGRQLKPSNVQDSDEEVRRAMAVIAAAEPGLLAKVIRASGRRGYSFRDKMRKLAASVAMDELDSSTDARR